MHGRFIQRVLENDQRPIGVVRLCRFPAFSLRLWRCARAPQSDAIAAAADAARPLHEIPWPALTVVEAQRRGSALFALRCAVVTMLGVTVKCGNRTRWRYPRAAQESRFRGIQLQGSCRPGTRRLRYGYRLVLVLVSGQVHRPVCRLDFRVKLALLTCK